MLMSWSRRSGFALLLSLLLVLPACASTPVSTGYGCGQSPVSCLQGNAQVALTTEKGRVLLEVQGQQAPLSAGNFLDLVQRGAYANTVFHRVVRDPSPFVVQGGDPRSSDPKVPPGQYGTGNFTDPATGSPRFIPLEVKLQGESEPRYGNPVLGAGISDRLALPHQRGALAMARSQDPNSASAQFYIALSDLPELDGRYAVFGRVIEGMDVVDQIRQGDKLIKAEIVQP